jgi:CRP-like cAMP-binding protein
MALSAQTILERTRLFRGLPAATLQRVAALAARRKYEIGGVVFSQGDPGNALYGVITGRIRISASARDGKEIFLNLMEPGDCFGEIALLDGSERTATAMATAPTELTVIGREHFLSLVQREPVLTNHLLQLLCSRIRWTSKWSEDSALLPVPARLGRRLLSLAKQHGQPTDLGLRLVISQEELARFLGLSRQVVNQYLQEWKARKWVELGRGKLTLLNEAAIRGIADDDSANLAK